MRYVYAVMRNYEYESDELLGAFSSRKLAEKAIKSINTPIRTHCEIIRIKLDAKLISWAEDLG